MRKSIKHRKSNRLKDYNYSKEGCYFITICTRKMVGCFGKIEQEKMILNKIGKITENQWSEIPKYYRDVDIDEFAIMPNHIHGLLVILKDNFKRTEQCSFSTNYGLISKIVKSFKETVTKTIRHKYKNFDFEWQRSFYDHVIRNEKSLENIRKYIVNNPLKWKLDKYNPENYFK